MTFYEAETEKRKHLYLIDKCFVAAIITHLIVVPENAPYDIIKHLIIDRISNPSFTDEQIEDFYEYKVLVICAERFHIDKTYWSYDLGWVLGQSPLFWENLR